MFYFFSFIILFEAVATFSPVQGEEWSKPLTLSELGQNASSPQVATDSLGNVIAVWQRFNGHHLVIQSSSKKLGGRWLPAAENLSLPNQDAFNPQIVIDSLGNAIAIWECFDGKNIVIQASVKQPGKPWQSIPDQLSYSGADAYAPQIAVDSFGIATAVWQSSQCKESMIQAASKPLNRKWLPPSNLSLNGWNAKNPQLIIDANDTATVVWQASNGYGEVIQASSKNFQEDWQESPDILCKSSLCNANPQIATDPYGNATVVWNRYDGEHATILCSTRSDWGGWQEQPDRLSSPDRKSFSPRLAVNFAGDITAVWESFDEKKLKTIYTSTKPFGGTWQPIPERLSQPGDHYVNPRIAMDASGNGIIVWTSSKGFTRLYAAVRPFGKSWNILKKELSSPGRSAFQQQVALDNRGRGIVIWVMQDSLSFIQAIDFNL